jgi:PPK2 family polyphosphate:nucleotide phosphotransferase
MRDLRSARLAEMVKPFVVKPGRQVILGTDYDPGYTADFIQKEEGDDLLRESTDLLCEYQARLAAQDTYGLLTIIQALDAAGKDGTIRNVMSGVNPQGVHVASFKAPSAEELDHDYLWRCAQRLPARGDITIFNRSYYEEVLVVRVHPELLAAEHLPAAAKKGDFWKRRYRDINNWEHYLVDNGFPIVKLFLNVSKEEQRQRFLDRLEEPDKNWKYSAADVAERKHWDEYQQAFSEMLSHTSTPWAPWYVIPADQKWFARVAAAAVIVGALAKIDPQFPVAAPEARQGLLEARAALEAEAPKPKRARRKPEPPEETAAEGETAAEPAETDAQASAPETPADGESQAPLDALKGRIIRSGEIKLDGKRYRDDVVIEAGRIRRRKKKPSRAFREADGHTPLSLAEDIPWGGGRLIVGTGIEGGMPVMAEVYEEADKRGFGVTAAPLEEALGILADTPRRDVFAVLHITC